MISVRKKLNLFALLAFCLLLNACSPTSSNPLDEQREPHFLTGKSRVNSMDYEGAIEAFEKAIEVNPRSASAHFELGLLYENNEQDFAAAIYHFDRFLKLRPSSEYAEVVQQRIVACKQELAKSVSLGPLSQNMQRDLERLTDENKDLRQKLDAWQAYYTANGARLTNPAVATPQISAPQPTAVAQQTSPTIANNAQPTATKAAPKVATPTKILTRSYAIKPGETPASIARKYGIKLETLLAANPGLNVKHLKVGQTIVIPAP